MALIFGLSSIPSPPALPGRDMDKLVHAFLYALLGALMVRALAGGWRRPVTLRVAVLAVALTTIYGISDEIHQAFVPPRQPDALDVMADGIGATLAAATMYAGIIRGRDGS
jgi:VanZ family protein